MVLDYKVIGNRIKSMRKQKSITQEKLAKKLNLSISYISRLERGRAPINLQILTQISEYIGIPVNYFITGTVGEKNNYINSEFEDIFNSCTQDKQKCILDIAKLVVKL